MTDSQRAEALKGLIADCHQTALAHGFWEEPNFAEKIALAHSELSEALEAWRDLQKGGGQQADEHCPAFSALEVELADAVIRVFDLAGYYSLDLADAMLAKMRANEARPYKHGKRC